MWKLFQRLILVVMSSQVDKHYFSFADRNKNHSG